MIRTELPRQLPVDGILYDIRSDFRAALRVIAAMNDDGLTDRQKAHVVLVVMYPRWREISDYDEAIRQAMWFISCDEQPDESKPQPVLMNWEQDFPVIVAPVNRVLGYECRLADYLHWWTFVGAYREIGECYFSHTVNIRDKKLRGKKLEKWEAEFYRNNQKAVDLKAKDDSRAQEFVDRLLGGGILGK